MLKTKMSFKILSFILFVGCLISCENDSNDELENPSILSDSQEISKEPLPQISPTNSSESNNKALNDLYAIWENYGGEPGNFVRNGNTVTETVFVTPQRVYNFEVIREDSNFVYIEDAPRNIELVLPVHNPGNPAMVYILGSNGYQFWRQFTYIECPISTVRPETIFDPFCFNARISISASPLGDQYEWRVSGNARALVNGQWVDPRATTITNNNSITVQTGGDEDENDPIIFDGISSFRVEVRARRGCSSWSRWEGRYYNLEQPSPVRPCISN